MRMDSTHDQPYDVDEFAVCAGGENGLVLHIAGP